MMPRKIDWLHWVWGRFRVGWHRHGLCWRLRFYRTRYSRMTIYGFWRAFFVIEDRLGESAPVMRKAA